MPSSISQVTHQQDPGTLDLGMDKAPARRSILMDEKSQLEASLHRYITGQFLLPFCMYDCCRVDMALSRARHDVRDTMPVWPGDGKCNKCHGSLTVPARPSDCLSLWGSPLSSAALPEQFVMFGDVS